MSVTVTAAYELVRYSPATNSGQPFQIIGSSSSMIGADVEIAMTYEKAADLVKSLSLLLLSVANKEGEDNGQG